MNQASFVSGQQTVMRSPALRLRQAGELGRAFVLGLASALFLIVPLAAPLSAAATRSVEVTIDLPMRSEVDTRERDTLLIAPFIVVSREGEGGFEDSDPDLQRALERYVERVMRRETDFTLVEAGRISYPTHDLDGLANDAVFWSTLAERADADLLLVGSVDFDVQDRSGYRVEEYPSPLDGRTLYRQVLVEQTGFELDIHLLVVDGPSGALLLGDNFKDFRAFDSGSADVRQGLFENLRALEERLVGLFAPRQVTGSRLLLIE